MQQPSHSSVTLNGLTIRQPDGSSTIVRARAIFRTLGPYRAARFLRKRGWSVEATAYLLLNR